MPGRWSVPSPTARAVPRDGHAPGPFPERPGAEPWEHRLYAHLGWATLNGLPLVRPERLLAVEVHLISLCRRLDVEPLEVAARPTRVHVLVRFKPSQNLADLATRLKHGSEEAMVRSATPIRWARGCAGVTVDPGEVRRLRRRLLSLGERDGPTGRVPASS